jgi:uncharacterized damage-inducible protein DinB
MTGAELIAHQLDTTGHQLTRVFEGIKEEHQDYKACSKAMTPKETLEHLCECYQAFLTESQGGSYEWGSFSIADKSWENLLSQFNSLRGRAVQLAKGSQETRVLRSASAYMVLHDAYHVGQMASCRIETDADWDPYSIY